MANPIRPDCIRKPLNPVARSYVPPGSEPYPVKDQDSWQSVAATRGRDAWSLIRFNYPTLPADNRTASLEVNWYLREYVGCTAVTTDGKNYIFTKSAKPGVIHVPVQVPALNFWRFKKTLPYIYKEMITHAKSDQVAQIKTLNEGKAPRGPRGPAGEPGELAARAGEIWAMKTQALLQWALLVKGGAPWDHKPKLAGMLKLSAGDQHFPIEGDSDHEYFYDIWSNIHFAYVGRAAGFTEWELQMGHQLGGPAGATDPADVESVQLGLDLWKQYGLNLTQNQLHQAILARKDKYLHIQGTPAYKKAVGPNFVHLEPITDGE